MPCQHNTAVISYQTFWLSNWLAVITRILKKLDWCSLKLYVCFFLYINLNLITHFKDPKITWLTCISYFDLCLKQPPVTLNWTREVILKRKSRGHFSSLNYLFPLICWCAFCYILLRQKLEVPCVSHLKCTLSSKISLIDCRQTNERISSGKEIEEILLKFECLIYTIALIYCPKPLWFQWDLLCSKHSKIPIVIYWSKYFKLSSAVNFVFALTTRIHWNRVACW